MKTVHNFALGLAVILACGSAAGAVSSQTRTTPDDRVEVVVRPDEGLQRRTVLARELVNLSAGPNFAKEVERAMADQFDKLDQDGGDEAAWVRANMPPMMTRMVNRMMEELAPTYAAVFTEEELRGQIDFYRSPVGQAVAAKAVPLALAQQEVETEIATAFMTEFQSKFCARFDCDGLGGQAAAKPSRH